MSTTALGSAESEREQQLYRIRHSLAHVMAEAVVDMFPDAKLAIGPPIADGFYYDFDLPRSITLDDLPQIEQRMRSIINTPWHFERQQITRDEAKRMFASQPFKLELIADIPDSEDISAYRQNNFVDLCRGPHVSGSEELHAESFKLLSVAGAYWRGNERLPMLQRIYATAWHTPEELHAHIERLEMAQQRDHRILGRELDLFSIHEDGGPGLIYWHPRGARIRLEIENYWRAQHIANGYDLLYTPHIGKAGLWEKSGHLDFYTANMFAPMNIDNNEYYAKPMNCPFHIMIYKNAQRSYRDLPLRWAELGTVYRYERSGVLHGLLRVRGFTQDDAHIFCTPRQIDDEIISVLQFSLDTWHDFGFDDITAYLATRPEKYVGNIEDWERAECALRAALEKQGIPFHIDKGGGAFYGPKIDLKIKDILQREWQMTTIQFDFNLPERFDMHFVDSNGQLTRPVMVHRALLGSLERFFGVLIEHYGGRFPLWLSPEHIRLLPVSEKLNDYVSHVANALRTAMLRVTVDDSSDRLGQKIRHAHGRRVPYIAIIGEREAQAESITVRRGEGGAQHTYSISDAISFLQDEIARHGRTEE